MDKRIRRNEVCIIGSPSCDFVFSATRSCFIAYGFEESSLEVTILKDLLKNNGIEAVEAGGMLTPAQSAFCTKICSKIINSQFCIILLNNDLKDGKEIPNANVNMEYGLMLGFNKYIIPFQKKPQNLPFNISGLDTVKYTNRDFESKAEKAIKDAVKITSQNEPNLSGIDQVLSTFLLIKKAVVARVDLSGDRAIFDLGSPIGFNLLTDFKGTTYIYLGNFSALRAETILWRVRILNNIFNERTKTIDERVKMGLVTKEQSETLNVVLKRTKVWLLVASKNDKLKIMEDLKQNPVSLATEVFSVDEVHSEVEKQIS